MNKLGYTYFTEKDVIKMNEKSKTAAPTPVPDGECSPRDRMLADFKEYLTRRQLADSTVHSYLYGTGQFLEQYRTVSPNNLKLYKCYLLEHYRPRTVNLRIRSMNCFLEFLHLTDLRMTMVPMQQKTFLDNVISQADYEYLKQCLLRDGNRLYYFVIRILADTGMRISEAVRLRVEDVRRGWLDVCSKGSKVRRVYIPLRVREECLAWLADENRDRGFLFLNRFGDPLTPAAIRGQMHRFAGLYGLDAAVLHPHSFRHLFAKNFIETCGDLPMLSDLLGHENIETTRIYLHRSPSEQKRLVNQIVKW